MAVFDSPIRLDTMEDTMEETMEDVSEAYAKTYFVLNLRCCRGGRVDQSDVAKSILGRFLFRESGHNRQLF
jgi:hypothetical protein